MKTSLLVFLWLLLSSEANADRVEKFPEIKAMTRQQLAEWLAGSHAPSSTSEICSAILDSSRVDLVEQSLQTFWTRSTMLDYISGRPDSDFRDEVMLMMLRTNVSEFKSWDEIEPLRYEPNKSYLPVNLLPPNSGYGELIKRYLPGLPLEDRLVSTKAMRNHLADALGEAKAHPERVADIITRLRDYPTADPDYNRGEGRVAPQNPGDPPLPLVGPRTPEERARGEALMAEVNADLKRQSAIIEADKRRRADAEIAARQKGVPQQPSLNPPPAPVNQSQPRAAASSWLLWTGLAGMNATVFLVLWLTTRHLRQRGHGI